jgi:hypothetical protein
MELSQKYIEVKEFDISDDFFDKLHESGIEVAVSISRAISDSYIEIPDDCVISHTIGGIASLDDEDIPFSIKFIKIDAETILLSDIHLISMDEYLDFINLNLYIKNHDEHTQSNPPEGDSEPSV